MNFQKGVGTINPPTQDIHPEAPQLLGLILKNKITISPPLNKNWFWIKFVKIEFR